MKPTLSVLITYYNEKHLLGECLASLLSQPNPPEEILIYDDASTYPARDYIPEAFPVRIIRNEVNRGPAYGRNALLDASSCDYVHFHDADDLFHNTWCERIRSVINNSEVDIIFTELASYYNGKIVVEKLLLLEDAKTREDLIRLAIRGSILASASTSRRQTTLRIGGYSKVLNRAEDFEYHLRFLAAHPTYTIIPEALIWRRNRDQSQSSRRKSEAWKAVCSALEMLVEHLPEYYKIDLAEKAVFVGSKLFQLGDHQGARDSFKLAYWLGLPTFAHQRRFYQFIARRLGPETAEWLSLVYRSVLPEPLRRYIVRWG